METIKELKKELSETMDNIMLESLINDSKYDSFKDYVKDMKNFTYDNVINKR